jgi:hypothetical protein
VPLAAGHTRALGGGPAAQGAGFELGFTLAAALAAAAAGALAVAGLRARRRPAGDAGRLGGGNPAQVAAAGRRQS